MPSEEPVLRWLTFYLRTLRWSLGERYIPSLGRWRMAPWPPLGITPLPCATIGHLQASLALIPFIPTGFFPDVDIGQSELHIELPPGATLDDNLAVAGRLSEMLRARSEVAHVLVSAGGAGDIRKANSVVKLVPRGDRKMNQKQFETSIRPTLLSVPGIRFSFSGTGFSDKDVSVILSGDDGPGV